MKIFGALVMKYVRAVFAVTETYNDMKCTGVVDVMEHVETIETDQITKMKIAKDCVMIYEVLQHDQNLLTDYVSWNIYENSVKWLCAELNACDTVRNLLFVIKINKHCCYLRDILLAIHEEWMKIYGSVYVVYTTVEKCNEQEEEEVKDILGALIELSRDEKKLELNLCIDRDILGGFTLLVNDKMYDHSLATLLNNVMRDLDDSLNIEIE